MTTERLELVSFTPELIRASLESNAALAAVLGATVPPTWPPELLDRAALEYSLARLAEGPEYVEWSGFFVLLRDTGAGRTLIGGVGYHGPPSADGTVEVGYGILPDHQRRGYATEAVRALLARAFAAPGIRRVIAETMPELTPSLGVLRKLGFRPAEEASEPGALRFELPREGCLVL